MFTLKYMVQRSISLLLLMGSIGCNILLYLSINLNPHLLSVNFNSP